VYPGGLGHVYPAVHPEGLRHVPTNAEGAGTAVPVHHLPILPLQLLVVGAELLALQDDSAPALRLAPGLTGMQHPAISKASPSLLNHACKQAVHHATAITCFSLTNA
jgi:hypothetical protein